MPFVKAGMFASLAAIADVDPAQGPRDPEPAPAASAGPHEVGESGTTMPTEGRLDPSPDTLAVGTVVLAPEGPLLGWWEAVGWSKRETT